MLWGCDQDSPFNRAGDLNRSDIQEMSFNFTSSRTMEYSVHFVVHLPICLVPWEFCFLQSCCFSVLGKFLSVLLLCFQPLEGYSSEPTEAPQRLCGDLSWLSCLPQSQPSVAHTWAPDVSAGCLREMFSALLLCLFLEVGPCLVLKEGPICFGRGHIFQISSLPPSFNILLPYTWWKPMTKKWGVGTELSCGRDAMGFLSH